MSTPYQIKVKGCLDAKLCTWFEGFDILHTPEGETLLTGSVLDQAALHGVLARCRDLGLPLISINPIPPELTTTELKTFTELREGD